MKTKLLMIWVIPFLLSLVIGFFTGTDHWKRMKLSSMVQDAVGEIAPYYTALKHMEVNDISSTTNDLRSELATNIGYLDVMLGSDYFGEVIDGEICDSIKLVSMYADKTEILDNKEIIGYSKIEVDQIEKNCLSQKLRHY